MSEKIAHNISIIFHPLLMPTYLLATIFYISPEVITGLQAYQSSPINKYLRIGFRENLLFFIFLSTFLMPASLIYYLYKVKIIGSITMNELSERRIPYFLTFILYLFFSYFLKYKLPLLKEIFICLFAVSICLFFVFILSFVWKISAHLVGISGVMGSIAGILFKFGADQLFYPLLFVLILVGIIATARLRLNAHTPSQIFAGFLLGFSVSVSSIILYF